MGENAPFIVHQGMIPTVESVSEYYEEFGVKGACMLLLPTPWSPSFFLFSTSAFKRYRTFPDPIKFSLSKPQGKRDQPPLLGLEDISEDISSPEYILTSEEHDQLKAELHYLTPSQDDFVIVRSSAVDENLASRGWYRSVKCQATIESLTSAIYQVFTSCPPESVTSMGIVVQRYVNIRRAGGYLSNERRVSKYISSWICEFEAVSGVGSPRIFTFSSLQVENHPESEGLLCDSRRSLSQMLKKVAAWAHSKKLRLHFEWIWDGSHLWIVQSDYVPNIKGDSPSASRVKIAQCVVPWSPSILSHEQKLPKGIWNKLDCVKTFREKNLPTTDLWVLHDRETLLELHSGKISLALRHDIEALLKSPIVIRTDITVQNSEVELLLPRTDTVTTIREAEEFLVKKVAELKQSIIDQQKLCFILHRFIPAYSSAFALAGPNRTRVKIDGLWGLPDGLLYYPHDSYDASHDGVGEIFKHIRFKEEFLDLDSKGCWIPKRAGPPYDWKSSLTMDELREIARGTYKIACAVGKAVQLMWFTGIPPGLGHPACLPWYYSTEEPPNRLPEHKKGLVPRGPVIRNQEDVERLRIEIEEHKSTSTIRLRPIPDLLRSKQFIKDVSALAKQLSVAVELEGSILSHAYYLLKRYGVDVLCSDPFALKFKPKRFDKLVRDKIPVRIESHGEIVEVIRLTGRELSSFLRAKVVEEALELFWTDTPEHRMEEIADLLEVLRALSKHEDFKDNQLEKIIKNKRAQRGGFDEGLILKQTQDVPLIQVESDASNLFDDIKSYNNVGREISRSQGMLTFVGPLPRKEGPDLTIPLIPPDPGQRHYSCPPIRYENLGISVNIRFREKDVLIEISKLEKKRDYNNLNQLKLFDF